MEKKKTKAGRAVIGFALGGLGDSCFYGFITSYLLMFLTTVVKMDAGRAGTVASVTILTDAVLSLFAGRFTDGLKCKYGRRRPIIIVTTFTMSGAFFMMFRNFQPGNPTLQMIYYLAAGFLFWGSFSFYYVSYVALGADVATGYEERIRLNTYSRMVGVLAGLMSTAIPIGIIGKLEDNGVEPAKAWGWTTTGIAIFIVIGLFFCWYFTRGAERLDAEKVVAQPVKYMLRDFGQLLKIKPYRQLIYSKMFMYACQSFYGGAMLFYLTFVMNASSEFTSFVYTYKQVISFFLVFAISWGALKFGKRNYIVAVTALAGIGSLILYMIGINSKALLILFGTLYTIVLASFWQLINTNYYDISDIDAFLNGTRREGNVMALQSFLTTIITSVAVKALAVLLDVSGFDGNLTVQAAPAISMLKVCFILIPAVTMLGITLMMLRYKVTKSGLTVLNKCQERKDAGEEIPQEDLDKIYEMLK